MPQVIEFLFKIHDVTPIKILWISLFIVSWLSACVVLWRHRNQSNSTIFLRIYLCTWLLDICKYQPWWNLEFQLLMDTALMLAVLETIYKSWVLINHKQVIFMLMGTLVLTAGKNYAGISKLAYFSHLYTLSITAGVLVDSLVRNLRAGFLDICGCTFLIWVMTQLLSSTTGRSWWFIVGSLRLIVQTCCLFAWYTTIDYQQEEIHA